MVEGPDEPRVFQVDEHFLQYIVDALLGSGGSGQVYAVRHRLTEDRFALKVLHRAHVSNPRMVMRALREARAGYRIRHYNVVLLRDLGYEPTGVVWQVMELLSGCTLAELLRRYGRCSPLYALDVALEIAFALQAAHDLLIIHRDVKPSNVFLTDGGVVKLIDFSLAKVLGDDFTTTAGAGFGLGTPAFMAPEHFSGAPASPLLDVYALGLLMWNLMVGRHPFAAVLDDLQALMQHHETVQPAPLTALLGVPEAVDNVIRGATAKEPSARFQGMWPMAQAIISARHELAGHPLARVRPAWEVKHPVVSNPRGWSAYFPPRPLPVSPPISTGTPSGPTVVPAPSDEEDGAPTQRRRPASS